MKSIWKTQAAPQDLNANLEHTIHRSLGIVVSEVGPDYLEAQMPVDSRTHQPRGLLHGGASAVLAESLGSIGSFLVAGAEQKTCVGIELNISHLRGVATGQVTGRATPIRLGKTLHVWEIQIWNSADPEKKPIAVSRLTVLIQSRLKSEVFSSIHSGQT
jgi:1,4-dihydroxy-2-naphthoyl-CoA hydrolase